MNEKKAKLKFNQNNYEIVETGDFVICAVSGKKIQLNKILIFYLILHTFVEPLLVKNKAPVIRRSNKLIG